MKILALLVILLSCATDIKQELAPLPMNFETQLKSYFRRAGGRAELHNNVVQEKRVAVFDWDNTMIKNDVGDATFFWMIEHNLFIAPKTWASTSPFLNEKALQHLNRDCPVEHKSKRLHLQTATGPCGKTLLSIYADGVLANGDPAWDKKAKLYNKMYIEPSYAWAASLLQGHEPEDIKEIAKMAIEFFLMQPIGAKRKIHEKEYAGFIRIYAPMQTLMDYLQKNHVTVWIISASEQHLVEVFADKVGISANHVIGIRPVIHQGVLTSKFESCGDIPENNQQIITYRQGKRCWANKIIFKVEAGPAQLNRPAPIFFGAGDSDTDLEFLRDSQIRLVINRNKTELMCQALSSNTDSWFISPMFIEPKPKKTTPYDCSSWGITSQQEP